MVERSAPRNYAGLPEALSLARRVHGLHESRDGRPYYEHAFAVLERVDALLQLVPVEVLDPRAAEWTRIVAVLHDVVEERRHTGIGAEDLHAHGFEPSVVAGVVRLSGRPEGVSYQDNILALIAEDDLRLMLVKLADNDHNMDPARIEALPAEDRGILRRYARSSSALSEAIGRRIGAAPTLPILPVARPEPAAAPAA